jgi:ribonuclease HI
LNTGQPPAVAVYTDGGCDKNPGGTGGWAFRIIAGDRVLERSGRVENTTNNRMELTAAIEALKALKKRSKVNLFTDSQYLALGMSQWLSGWIKRGWKLKTGDQVKNADLWRELHDLSRKHDVEWIWVRGHSGDKDNVRVDKMVGEAIRGRVDPGSRRKSAEVTAVPEVKVNRIKGKPASVTITLKSGRDSRTDRPARMKIAPQHLQKLIEDLIAAQREIEES